MEQRRRLAGALYRMMHRKISMAFEQWQFACNKNTKDKMDLLRKENPAQWQLARAIRRRDNLASKELLVREEQYVDFNEKQKRRPYELARDVASGVRLLEGRDLKTMKKSVQEERMDIEKHRDERFALRRDRITW